MRIERAYSKLAILQIGEHYSSRCHCLPQEGSEGNTHGARAAAEGMLDVDAGIEAAVASKIDGKVAGTIAVAVRLIQRSRVVTGDQSDERGVASFFDNRASAS